jgi:hypothetical protein
MGVRRRVFDEIGSFEALDRGSDSVLVRRSADRYGCESIRYVASARVLHLEIDDVASYYRKVFTYARSMRRFSVLVPTRTPGHDLRRRIFELCCREHRYPVFRRAVLGALLAVESLAWMLGWRLIPREKQPQLVRQET